MANANRLIWSIWSAISFYAPIHEARQIRPIWRVVIRVHITIRESPYVRILVPTQKGASF